MKITSLNYLLAFHFEMIDRLMPRKSICLLYPNMYAMNTWQSSKLMQFQESAMVTSSVVKLTITFHINVKFLFLFFR